MKEIIALDSRELVFIRPLLDRFSERAGYMITLNSLLLRWDRFVNHVESGYDDSIYEYANDLSVRGLLKQIEDTAPDSLRSKLAVYLKGLDRRFLRATYESTGRIPGWLPHEVSDSWSNRIPQKMVGELVNDLRAAGIRRR